MAKILPFKRSTGSWDSDMRDAAQRKEHNARVLDRAGKPAPTCHDIGMPTSIDDMTWFDFDDIINRDDNGPAGPEEK